MDKETLRLQMLSGIITESEYKAKLEEGSLSIPSKAEKISDKVIKWYEKHPNDKMKELLNSVEKNLEKMLSKTTGKNAIKVEEFEKMVKSKYPKPFEDPNYSTFKKSLNENFVGMGMVGNIFDREKTDYEMAFEHFSKGTSLNELEEGKEVEEPSLYEAAPDTGHQIEKYKSLSKMAFDYLAKETDDTRKKQLRDLIWAYEKALVDLESQLNK